MSRWIVVGLAVALIGCSYSRVRLIDADGTSYDAVQIAAPFARTSGSADLLYGWGGADASGEIRVGAAATADLEQQSSALAIAVEAAVAGAIKGLAP